MSLRRALCAWRGTLRARAEQASPPPRTLRESMVVLAEGLANGAAVGARVGSGIEASGVRGYQPTDDARRIDWAVSARLGSPHVREFHAEIELPNLIVLDGALRTWPAAWRVAITAAGGLALTQLGAGHPVGLIEASLESAAVTPPRIGERHAQRLLNRLLAQPDPQPNAMPGVRSGGSGIAAALRVARTTLEERGLVFLVSDFRVPPSGAWLTEAIALVHRHALVPIWVATPSAADLPPVGVVDVMRGSTVAALDTSSPRVREALRLEEGTHLAEMDSAFARLRTRPVRLSVGEDPSAVLVAHFRSMRGWAA